MIDIKAILETAIENEASDIHINVGMPPVLRKNTELIDLDLPPVTNEDAKDMVVSMVGNEPPIPCQRSRPARHYRNLVQGNTQPGLRSG